MPIVLVLLFIGVPVLEIAVFIRVGDVIGLWPTLGLVVATAVAGAMMLRHQGYATLQRAQRTMAEHRFPADELFEGACLFMAGALLLTPGFVTDSIGLLMMFPPFRRWLRQMVFRAAKRSGTVVFHGAGGPPPDAPPNTPPGTPGRRGGNVIEGEYRDMPPEHRPNGSTPPTGGHGAPPDDRNGGRNGGAPPSGKWGGR